MVRERERLDHLRDELVLVEEAWSAGEGDFARGYLEELVASLLEGPGIASEAELVVLARLEALAEELSLLEALHAVRVRILAGLEHLLPPDHSGVPLARHKLAATLRDVGDLEGALALFESVLETHERLLPPDHTELLASRANLAATRMQLGDLDGARVLQEAVLAAYETKFDEGHQAVLAVRANLAATLMQMGDLDGARALEEAVLAARERRLPADHPEVLRARSNLAATLQQAGDLEGARAHQEAVVAARERLLPPEHPDLVNARENLAATRLELGDLEEARALLESVLAAREPLLDPPHPLLLRPRGNLASTLLRSGDAEGAQALQEAVLEAYELLLPSHHPELLGARENLAATRVARDDREGTLALFPAQHEGLLQRHVQALSASPREARAVARAETDRVEGILSWGRGAGREGALFSLLETRRHASTAPIGGIEDEELAPLRHGLERSRRELNDLVLSGPAAGQEPARWKERVEAVSRERDRVLARLRAELRRRGSLVEAIRPEALARWLPEGALAVGFTRSRPRDVDPTTGLVEEGPGELVAMVLDGTGAVRRVELGEAAGAEALLKRWNPSAGARLQRGEPVFAAADAGADLAAGRELRARLLDPVLEGVDEGARIFCVLDDFLHLVPLDALPLDRENERVGDRWRIRHEVSFARLLQAGRAVRGEGLTIVGDVDFDGAATGDATAGAVEASARSAEFRGWAELSGTRDELEAIAGQYEDAFEDEAVVLSRGKATKDAFREAVRGKRFVHVATHGWFAPESVLSAIDAAESSGARSSLERTVRGLAPMTLCGLALAGANRGRDALGRVPGLLTAEELAAYDLSACELAVLSACETNIGIRRAGQGILSLQAALHSAGARSALTSLWRVDDARTKELMTRFYAGLWRDGMGKAEALWAAKRALREAGHPVSAWAGWVLTGDPD